MIKVNKKDDLSCPYCGCYIIDKSYKKDHYVCKNCGKLYTKEDINGQRALPPHGLTGAMHVRVLHLSMILDSMDTLEGAVLM